MNFLPLTLVLLVTVGQLQADPFVCGRCANPSGAVVSCCDGCVDGAGNGNASYDGKACENCSPPNGMASTCSYCTGICNSVGLVVPIYRFSGPNGDHLYSQNQNANANTSYGFENVLGLGRTCSGFGYAPLTEYVNTAGNSHFYTANATEGTIATQNGYTMTRIVFYIATTWTVNVNYLVNRYVNQGGGIYLLTLNPYDIGTTPYWVEDGVVGYMPTK